MFEDFITWVWIGLCVYTVHGVYKRIKAVGIRGWWKGTTTGS